LRKWRIIKEEEKNRKNGTGGGEKRGEAFRLAGNEVLCVRSKHMAQNTEVGILAKKQGGRGVKGGKNGV